jgi:hypothetical protein
VLKDTKLQLKGLDRQARIAPGLEVAQRLQQDIRKTETEQRRQRQDIFAVEDERSMAPSARSCLRTCCVARSNTSPRTLPPAAAPHVIDKGLPTASLLAQMLVAKYLDHLPLYRQEAIFERSGHLIARSTLARWVGECGVQL